MHINILVQIFWSDFISAMNSLVLNTLLVTVNTLAVKVPVNWPFLDLVPFNKQDHVQLFVHHGRIFGNIVVERGINEENGIRDFLATCELDIVLVFTGSVTQWTGYVVHPLLNYKFGPILTKKNNISVKICKKYGFL